MIKSQLKPLFVYYFVSGVLLVVQTKPTNQKCPQRWILDHQLLTLVGILIPRRIKKSKRDQERKGCQLCVCRQKQIVLDVDVTEKINNLMSFQSREPTTSCSFYSHFFCSYTPTSCFSAFALFPPAPPLTPVPPLPLLTA